MYEQILELARLGYKVTIERDAIQFLFTVYKDGCSFGQYRPDDHHATENRMKDCLNYMVEYVDEMIKQKKEKDGK